MSKNILIVDDDSDLTYIIAEMLEEHGYDVECTGSADDAFSILSGRSFDLILLDINLPDSSGFEICSELRRVSTVPVIFASARTSETDRITGFDIGGDDYLPKPYSMKELLSRVNALMRRVYGFGSEETVSFGDISVDISGRSVTRNGIPLTLSLREFDLLSFLCVRRKAAETLCTARKTQKAPASDNALQALFYQPSVCSLRGYLIFKLSQRDIFAAVQAVD